MNLSFSGTTPSSNHVEETSHQLNKPQRRGQHWHKPVTQFHLQDSRSHIWDARVFVHWSGICGNCFGLVHCKARNQIFFYKIVKVPLWKEYHVLVQHRFGKLSICNCYNNHHWWVAYTCCDCVWFALPDMQKELRFCSSKTMINDNFNYLSLINQHLCKF